MVDPIEKDSLSDLEIAVTYLANGSHDIVDAITLVNEQNKVNAKKVRKWTLIAFSAIVLGFVAVGGLAVYIVHLLGQSKDRGVENQKLYRQILNCVTVGSDCYTAQSLNTSGQTLEFLITASDCFAANPTDLDARNLCIYDGTGVTPAR